MTKLFSISYRLWCIVQCGLLLIQLESMVGFPAVSIKKIRFTQFRGSCDRHESDQEMRTPNIKPEQTVFRRKTLFVVEPSIPIGKAADHLSRRRVLLGLAAACTATIPALPAVAGLAELDSKTGNLFTPKADMLKGGSVAARGIPLSKSSARPPRAGESLQSIYETRFVAYLSRFLLNFDPSARAFWVQQGFGDSWEVQDSSSVIKAESAFAEFSESVEVGLADYFSGPFGSYSSLPAIVAGLNAAQPAPSRKADIPRKHGFINDIFSRGRQKKDSLKRADSFAMEKQGILNLYTLLKARYNSLSAKRQLAILFSFVSLPDLQPVNEIRSLLGEADNATITNVQFVNLRTVSSELDSRTSSRRGGGYSFGYLPTISVESPPPLGDKYLK